MYRIVQPPVDYVAEFHRMIRAARDETDRIARDMLLRIAEEHRRYCKEIGARASSIEWSTKPQPGGAR